MTHPSPQQSAELREAFEAEFPDPHVNGVSASVIDELTARRDLRFEGFAAAWNYLARRSPAGEGAEVDRITAFLNNPPYGQPDLYSRLHTAITRELGLAESFGKRREWFSAVRGLIDYLESRPALTKAGSEKKED